MSWVVRAAINGAYWISPDLELFPLDASDTHPGWITRRFESEGWEGMNAYHDAVDEGWTRMILGVANGLELWFEAKDIPTITTVLESLPPEFLNVRMITIDATSDGKSGEIMVGEGEDALSAWKRGLGKMMRETDTFLIGATDDIELALVIWQASNPTKTVIGRTPEGIWWNEPLGNQMTTGLTSWEEVRGYIK